MQQECLGHIGDMEAAMVKEFPFTVPSEYKDLPQLKVRVTADAGSSTSTHYTGMQCWTNRLAMRGASPTPSLSVGTCHVP